MINMIKSYFLDTLLEYFDIRHCENTTKEECWVWDKIRGTK